MLATLKEQVEDPVLFLSIGQTIGNLALAYGLKYLWKMVNLFQFIVFFQNWKIAISPRARLALEQVKVLAFFEFVDTTWFTKWVHESLGIECKECEEEDVEEYPNRLLEESNTSGDKVQMEPDATRLGSIDIVENLGIMLLFAFLLLVIVACLMLLRVIVKFNPEARGIYLKIKRKIFWNAFIRYVF